MTHILFSMLNVPDMNVSIHTVVETYNAVLVLSQLKTPTTKGHKQLEADTNHWYGDASKTPTKQYCPSCVQKVKQVCCSRLCWASYILSFSSGEATSSRDAEPHVASAVSAPPNEAPLSNAPRSTQTKEVSLPGACTRMHNHTRKEAHAHSLSHFIRTFTSLQVHILTYYIITLSRIHVLVHVHIHIHAHIGTHIFHLHP